MPEAQPMTEAMYYVLLALRTPAHGYSLLKRIREISGGRVEMGPGTLYGVLTRLRKEGLLELTAEEERRKTYALTETGRKALLEEYARLSRLVRDGAALKEEET
ncbi:MAG: PadR family transcriptional regulator [Candidatus Spyradocola sp.]|jgi:DNA-binding PadR family transcriptional regulator